MRVISKLLLCSYILLLCGCVVNNSDKGHSINARQVKKAGSLRVISFNIRNSAAQDGVNAWENRKLFLAQTVLDAKMDLIGFQEVMPNQMEFLRSQLKSYKGCGVAREDGKNKGEYAPVFFRKDRFTLLADSTLWLSETPGIPGSVSWQTACTRIVTWVRLRDNRSGIELCFMNTHFDHVSVLARNESAKLIHRIIDKEVPGIPVVVTGDFNMIDSDEAYNIMVGRENNLPSLNDVGSMAVTLKGPSYTFQAFDDESDDRCKIDYIFVNEYFKADNQQVLKAKSGELYVSDHYPLIADLHFRIPNKVVIPNDSLK